MTKSQFFFLSLSWVNFFFWGERESVCMAAVVHRAQQCSVLCSKGQRFSANGLVNSSFLNCTSNKSLKLQTNQPKITLFFQSLIFTKISVDLERLYLEVTEQTLSLCLWFVKSKPATNLTWSFDLISFLITLSFCFVNLFFDEFFFVKLFFTRLQTPLQAKNEAGGGWPPAQRAFGLGLNRVTEVCSSLCQAEWVV